MTNSVKVAVIGAGMMGKNHLKTYKSLPGVELVGVYDIFEDAAKLFLLFPQLPFLFSLY
jgi:predicted dehydrogenase